jgi:hypothetical protein
VDGARRGRDGLNAKHWPCRAARQWMPA